MEPLLPQPETMAPFVLPQPAPQVDRGANPRQPHAPRRGGRARGNTFNVARPISSSSSLISLLLLLLCLLFIVLLVIYNANPIRCLPFRLMQFAQEQEFFRQTALFSKEEKEKVTKSASLIAGLQVMGTGVLTVREINCTRKDPIFSLSLFLSPLPP